LNARERQLLLYKQLDIGKTLAIGDLELFSRSLGRCPVSPALTVGCKAAPTEHASVILIPDFP
jgi:hypothetical protein